MKPVKRFISCPAKSFFLFGPRGTGKSTWIKDRFPDAYLIDLLKHDCYREFLGHPELLIHIVEGNLEKRVFVIDEVQRNPDLLDTVHLLIEKHPSITFVLTGSSSRKLKRSGVDLLAGRAVKSVCHPFMASEMGKAFSLDEALQTGLIPLVVASESEKIQTLRAYLDLYVREEVQAEGLVRNLSAFARFLEAATFSHGSLLNATVIGRECHVNRMTVEGYLNVLEDLYLAKRLPLFSRHAKRELIAHDKFYYFDVGVYRMLRPKGPLDTPEQINGTALEGLVYQHLRAWIDYSCSDSTLWFWRTRGGSEVDFVIYGEATFVAIEVKNSNRIYPKDLNGLQTFHTDYPQAQRLLLYRGHEQMMINGVVCMPCDIFLKSLTPGKSILNNPPHK